MVHPGCCCPEKEAQRGGSGISPSELATEGEERSVRSSRTPSGGAEAGIEFVVACRIGAVSGLLCLKVLFGVNLFVAEHNSAVGAVVGDVVAMHSAVETMVGRFGLWSACTNVGSRG